MQGFITDLEWPEDQWLISWGARSYDASSYVSPLLHLPRPVLSAFAADSLAGSRVSRDAARNAATPRYWICVVGCLICISRRVRAAQPVYPVGRFKPLLAIRRERKVRCIPWTVDPLRLH